jgi:hypothetical protein
MERRWLSLASSYQFSEQLKSFSTPTRNNAAKWMERSIV